MLNILYFGLIPDCFRDKTVKESNLVASASQGKRQVRYMNFSSGRVLLKPERTFLKSKTAKTFRRKSN